MLGAQKKKEVNKRVADQQTGYDDALEENGTHAQIGALKRDISQDNVDELKALVLCHHEKALRLTFKTSRSEALHYNVAPLMIMALIDRGRYNTEDIERALPEVVTLNDNI